MTSKAKRTLEFWNGSKGRALLPSDYKKLESLEKYHPTSKRKSYFVRLNRKAETKHDFKLDLTEGTGWGKEAIFHTGKRLIFKPIDSSNKYLYAEPNKGDVSFGGYNLIRWEIRVEKKKKGGKFVFIDYLYWVPRQSKSAPIIRTSWRWKRDD